jgi:hypothetical protein
MVSFPHPVCTAYNSLPGSVYKLNVTTLLVYRLTSSTSLDGKWSRLITAPIPRNAGGAGIAESTSTKICLEEGGVCSIYIAVTVKISIAEKVVSTGVAKGTPAKMELE